MNTAQLLIHFDRIADAPDAIPRLRRFILDLAVRGKLVEQDPNDEPATELLKRIEQTRDERNKRKLALIEIDPSETDFDLPENWNLAPLSALGGWAIGAGFPKNEQGRMEGPYFFLKVSDMNLPGNEKIIVTAQNRIDNEVAARIRAKVHSIRTIIFPKIGGAIATNKRRILGRPSAIDNNCLGITITNEIELDWAYLLLTSLDFTRYQAGTAVPALQQGVLERIPVGIPPLAEQHRIVAKVEELMALCDRLETAGKEREATRNRLAAASLARLNAPDPAIFQNHTAFTLNNLAPLTTRPDQIKALRQTILNLAVRGKLVEQDPEDEPAVELLKRIAAEKARLVKAGEIRKPKKTALIDYSSLLFGAPPGWVWARLLDISRKIHYGFTASANQQIADVRLLRITDIQHNKVEWNSVPGCEIDEQTLPGFKLETGDILIARTGGTIGKSFLVVELPVVAVFASYLIRVQGSYEIYARYLKLFLESPIYWTQLREGTRGAGQPNVNGQTLGTMLVLLPPLAEQYRIVAKVDELIALCDRLEASLTIGDETRGRLVEVVLHEALGPRLY